MGTEASFQALPEHWPLLVRARHDREVAEWIESFHFLAAQIAADQSRNNRLFDPEFIRRSKP
jgi:hypothetical protein